MPQRDAAFYELLNKNLHDIGAGIGGGIEESYLRKQLAKEKEEERQKKIIENQANQRMQLETQGFQAVRPEQVVGTGEQIGREPSPFGRVNVGDVPMELNPMEQRKKTAEIKALEQKAKEVPVVIWNPATESYQRMDLPEGYTGKGAKVIQPKSDLPERKFQASQAEKQKADTAKSEAFKTNAMDTLKTIGKVREGIGNFGIKSLIPAIPGQPKADWKASLNKLLAGRILNVIGNMKDQSRTGATGFGQLNAGELKVITDASTELKENLSQERAAELLNDMEAAFNKIIEREYMSNGQGGQQSGQQEVTEDDIAETMRLHPEYTREQILQMIGGGQ